MSGKVDGGSDAGSWCPTRFVGATAVAAVDHIEAVYSGLDLRIGAAEIRMPGMAVASAKTATKKVHLTLLS